MELIELGCWPGYQPMANTSLLFTSGRLENHVAVVAAVVVVLFVLFVYNSTYSHPTAAIEAVRATDDLTNCFRRGVHS
jgi:hypothetical protein